MNLLDIIIACKKKELTESIRLNRFKDLEKSINFNRKCIPLSESILSQDKTGIIAEFKRKSPSKGIINSDVSIEEVTSGYSREGASGLSVLTDFEFFGGTVADLSLARKLNSTPILRKDFIVDEYQVVESKAIGADAILLIAAILHKKGLLKLARLARSIDLQVLLEVHNAHELEMVNEFVNIIGVNNRDLTTFLVNTRLSFSLADKIPEGFVKISESGISSPHIIKQLKQAGYQGFLIGEKFMNNSDPVAAFSDFIKMMN